jgi:hypothetical protein
MWSKQAIWDLGTKWEFVLWARKTTKTLIELAGRRTLGMQLTSNHQSGIKYTNPNGSPYLEVAP